MTSARLLFAEKRLFEDGSIYEVVIWAVPRAIPRSAHGYKYRLFFGRSGVRIVGYDNERGKGDHRHVEGIELRYEFVSIGKLLDDFRSDVERVSGKKL